MNIDCVRCKGRGMCKRSHCAHLIRACSVFRAKTRLPNESFASRSPAPFVGRFGYPGVNAGILAPADQSRADESDSPRSWAAAGYTIPSIVDLRSSLVNSRFKADVRKSARLLEAAQLVGMAQRPVSIELRLMEKPRFRLSPSDVLAPMGPDAGLRDAKITENPRVHTKAEKVAGDFSLKAAPAISYLHRNRFDENFLTRMLSIGNMGTQRRLVPTRWAITAVDDTIGRGLHRQVRDMAELGSFIAHFGSYLGNYYLVLFMPGPWSYELFECYMPKAGWNTADRQSYTTDYEPAEGRKSYAENCAGGYYSARLAVLEKLREIKRQAACLVLRIITGEYSVPLGVWVTREAARIALAGRPLEFGSRELALKYAGALARKKFSADISPMLRASIILRQSRLSNFF